ncbi:DUF6262 family protein [Streptomyces sp. NPDC060064]|uniref:DUF6262 family protein n=1 Tax=Streptomyces sp. NPDC060064 TaxID=3347049 RepID=UPI0036AA6368
MPPADNARFLVEASKMRSQQARERAEDVIKASGRRSERPTVVGIAHAARVSRSWLYTQTDLISAINQLQQRAPAPRRNGRHSASDTSLQRRLETMLERNRQLRDQVSNLTRKLETPTARSASSVPCDPAQRDLRAGPLSAVPLLRRIDTHGGYQRVVRTARGSRRRRLYRPGGLLRPAAPASATG